MSIEFYKYEGLGNDFLIIEGGAISTAQAIGLCDRHRGVGADGVLMLDVERPRMDVINSDGSVPEMCGNGIRCAALHLARQRRQSSLEVAIETAAGPHVCTVVDRPGSESVAVVMTVPSLVPRELPLHSDTPWVEHPLEVAGRTVHLTGVSMGNPHVVTFDDLEDSRFEVGPAIQSDPHFPEGINVGFVSEHEALAMRLHVLERGAGWTQACGTGACAAAVAAVETARSPRGEPIRVRLPGGDLVVTVGSEGEPVVMQGPARFVFRGEVGL